MAVARAERILCPCGGTQFISALELWRHPNQGMTPKLIGYVCQACHQMLDLQSQGQLADLKRKMEELEEIKQQIAAMEAG